ncbi:hypothetical protein [Variovorax sp. YR216]|uniref:hypothetical protein n=1 Tax=Variovorax sp. YR216 TaxID=1882828 RepID=UPI00115FFF74|nr:hypothetical protein [Variovorax sp. YR216]
MTILSAWAQAGCAFAGQRLPAIGSDQVRSNPDIVRPDNGVHSRGPKRLDGLKEGDTIRFNEEGRRVLVTGMQVLN